MRTIKFRGKLVNSDEWLYGGYYQASTGEHRIITVDETTGTITDWNVQSATIGRFTGLLDKNGKEIYEGDIVRYYDDIEDELVSSHVIYNKESCSFCVAPTKLCGDYIGVTAYWQFEVIGNIHDNPEMLKGGNDNGNL